MEGNELKVLKGHFFSDKITNITTPANATLPSNVILIEAKTETDETKREIDASFSSQFFQGVSNQKKDRFLSQVQVANEECRVFVEEMDVKKARNQISLFCHLLQMKKDELFVDVIINVNNQKLLCHKFVLAASSTYFFNLFSQNSCNEVTLNIDELAFNIILIFIYTGLTTIQRSNVELVEETAQILGIQEIMDLCSEYKRKVHASKFIDRSGNILINRKCFEDKQISMLGKLHLTSNNCEKISSTEPHDGSSKMLDNNHLDYICEWCNMCYSNCKDLDIHYAERHQDHFTNKTKYLKQEQKLNKNLISSPQSLVINDSNAFPQTPNYINSENSQNIIDLTDSEQESYRLRSSPFHSCSELLNPCQQCNKPTLEALMQNPTTNHNVTSQHRPIYNVRKRKILNPAAENLDVIQLNRSLPDDTLESIRTSTIQNSLSSKTFLKSNHSNILSSIPTSRTVSPSNMLMDSHNQINTNQAMIPHENTSYNIPHHVSSNCNDHLYTTGDNKTDSADYIFYSKGITSIFRNNNSSLANSTESKFVKSKGSDQLHYPTNAKLNTFFVPISSNSASSQHVMNSVSQNALAIVPSVTQINGLVSPKNPINFIDAHSRSQSEKNLNTYASLVQNMQTRNTLVGYICCSCNKFFDVKTVFLVHFKSNHSVRKCFKIIRYTYLDKNVSLNADEDIGYICKMCQHYEDTEALLARHMLYTHHSTVHCQAINFKTIVEHETEKWFNMNYLTSLESIDSFSKEFQEFSFGYLCRICSQFFKMNKYFILHIDNHHPCQKYFQLIKYKILEINKNHDALIVENLNRNIGFFCGICNLYQVKEDAIKKHMFFIHNEINKYNKILCTIVLDHETNDVICLKYLENLENKASGTGTHNNDTNVEENGNLFQLPDIVDGILEEKINSTTENNVTPKYSVFNEVKISEIVNECEDYACDDCNEIFSSFKFLKLHLFEEEHTFHCTGCKQFKTISLRDLFNHSKDSHSVGISGKLAQHLNKCPYCPFLDDSLLKLRKHIAEKHLNACSNSIEPTKSPMKTVYESTSDIVEKIPEVPTKKLKSKAAVVITNTLFELPYTRSKHTISLQVHNNTSTALPVENEKHTTIGVNSLKTESLKENTNDVQHNGFPNTFSEIINAKSIKPCCPTCNKNLKTLQTLQRHLVIIHNHTFESEEEFYQFLVSSNQAKNSKTLPTRIVSQNISDIESTLKKKSLNHNINSILPNEIPSAFCKDINLKSLKPICYICNKTFKALRDLRQHILLKHGIRAKSIEEFYQLLHLNQISNSEDIAPQKNKSCHMCSKTFCNLYNVKRHYEQAHKSKYTEKDGEIIKKCHLCSKTFQQKEHLYVHLASIHSCWQCDICNKKCKSENILVEHKNVHLFCNICMYQASSMVDLEGHSKAMHTPEDNYICCVCGFVTLLSEELTNHMNNLHKNSTDDIPVKLPCDTLDEPHWCMECRETFDSIELLKIHLKKYKHDLHCVICDFQATSQIVFHCHNANEHQIALSNDWKNSVLKCSQCEYFVESSYALENHVSMAHSGAKPVKQTKRTTQTQKNLKLTSDNILKNRKSQIDNSSTINTIEDIAKHDQKCIICGWTCIGYKTLLEHRRETDHRLTCDSCDFKTLDEDCLIVHGINKHQMSCPKEVINYIRFCSYCTFASMRSSQMKKHMKIHRSQNNKNPLKMLNSVISKNSIKQNMSKDNNLTVTPISRNISDISMKNKAFNKKERLSKNVKFSKQSERKLVNVKGSDKTSLNVVQKHTNLVKSKGDLYYPIIGKIPLRCTVCGKIFPNLTAVTRHRKIEKHFLNCPKCSYATYFDHFYYSHLVKQHKLSLSDRAKKLVYSCPHCHHAEGMLKYLESHLKVKHRDLSNVKLQIPNLIKNKVVPSHDRKLSKKSSSINKKLDTFAKSSKSSKLNSISSTCNNLKPNKDEEKSNLDKLKATVNSLLSEAKNESLVKNVPLIDTKNVSKPSLIFICNVCKIEFTGINLLFSHRQASRHLLCCSQCSYKTFNDCIYLCHLYNSHDIAIPEDNNFPTFKCPHCSFSLSDHSQLLQHIFDKHRSLKDDISEKSIELPSTYCKEDASLIKYKESSKTNDLPRLTSKIVQSSPLNRSENSKNPSSIFQCNVCKNEFVNRNSLFSHRANKKHFLRCPHCSYKSYKDNSYLIHLNNRHNIPLSENAKHFSIFLCPQCPFLLRYHSELLRHISIKHISLSDSISINDIDMQSSPYKKDVSFESLEKAISKSNELSVTKVNESSKPNSEQDVLTCSICFLFFPTLSTLMKHKDVKHHNDISLTHQQTNICPHCLHVAADFISLQKHSKHCHKIDENVQIAKQWLCDQCSFISKPIDLYEIVDHYLKIHQTKVKIYCSHCHHIYNLLDLKDVLTHLQNNHKEFIKDYESNLFSVLSIRNYEENESSENLGSVPVENSGFVF